MRATCVYPGCSKPQHGHGYCHGHCARLRRHGSVDVVKKKVAFGSVEERIAAMTRRQGDCLIYTGNLTNTGYGRIGIGQRRVLVHRLVTELHHGPPPSPRHMALHSCDIPPCCEPTHLRWGTARDNVCDMDERGRRVNADTVGSSNGRSRLTDQDVLNCRMRFAQGASARQLADEYGITMDAMRNACTGKRWSHLPVTPADIVASGLLELPAADERKAS